MRPLIICLIAVLSACSTFSFPGVHRITIQQGNVVTQQMIDKLRPGMTPNQVRFVLGNAILDDNLDQARWDYVYTVQLSGGKLTRRILSVYFEDGRLRHFEGDYKPSAETSES